MSLIIKGMKLPQHSAVNGEKDTVYRCIVLAHPDNTVELIIDTEFASAYDNGHNIQRYPLIELPTSHGRLIDAARFRIPMKATIKSESFKGRQLSVGYFCPKCHKPVLIRHLYCYECGQAIDWGDCS